MATLILSPETPILVSLLTWCICSFLECEISRNSFHFFLHLRCQNNHKFLMCPKILSLLPFEDAFKRASSASIIPCKVTARPCGGLCIRRPSCTCMFVCSVPVKINFPCVCLVVCVVSVKMTLRKHAWTVSVRCVSVQPLALSSTTTFVHSKVSHCSCTQHRSL